MVFKLPKRNYLRIVKGCSILHKIRNEENRKELGIGSMANKIMEKSVEKLKRIEKS